MLSGGAPSRTCGRNRGTRSEVMPPFTVETQRHDETIRRVVPAHHGKWHARGQCSVRRSLKDARQGVLDAEEAPERQAGAERRHGDPRRPAGSRSAAGSRSCPAPRSARSRRPAGRRRRSSPRRAAGSPAAPPSAPKITPSSTNGQRMNQSVAPTSFITSTSRRRANSESRMVLAISSTEATPSSPASSAIVSFTTRVTERILFVSSSRLRTSSIAGSTMVRPPPGPAGASASLDRRCRRGGPA